MSSPLADRLRGVMRGAERVPSVVARGFSRAESAGLKPGATTERTSVRGDANAVAEDLGGEWAESRRGRYLVIDRTYGPGHRHGRAAVMDALPPWPRLDLLSDSDPRDRLLFIDCETTGLAGGAGTYAFLVGCGWFEPPSPSAWASRSGVGFRIRQFFLSSYSAEAALLEGLAHVADGVTGVVSFNGKSFDLPLIETRFLMHRMETPFAGLPHVDMLHPARRLWRGDDDEAARTTSSCRLSVLEQALCGLAREGDVPAFEIPARYFSYVRSGDARPLGAVLEHNRLDLLSLALLTARAARLLDEGPAAARTAREALGLGRLYERGGLCEEAREAYARAAGWRGPDLCGSEDPRLQKNEDLLARAEALRCCAVLCRRQRRFGEAAAAWQRILDLRRCPPHLAREATEALAVHHEHRLRDPRAARVFALQTLRFDGTPSRQHAVHHRLARLERKLDGPATQSLRF